MTALPAGRTGDGVTADGLARSRHDDRRGAREQCIPRPPVASRPGCPAPDTEVAATLNLSVLVPRPIFPTSSR